MSLSSIHRADGSSMSNNSGKFSDIYLNYGKVNDLPNKKLRRRTIVFGESFWPLRPLSLTTSENLSNDSLKNLQHNSIKSHNDHENDSEQQNQIVGTRNTSVNATEDETIVTETPVISAEVGNALLIRQLRHAKEMGFTDAEILIALEMNGTNMEEISNGVGGDQKKGFKPFLSISAMVDVLSNAQAHLQINKKFKTNGEGEQRIHNGPSSSSNYTMPKLDNNNIGSRLSLMNLDYQHQQQDKPSLPSSNECLSSFKPEANNSSRRNSSFLSIMHNSDSFSSNKNVKSIKDTKDTLTTPTNPIVSRSASFNDTYEKKRRFTPLPRRHLTVEFGSINNNHNNLLATTNSSTIQRLVETFENENRRHFNEFQQINNQLRRKLESNNAEIEQLRKSLRRKTDEVERQAQQLKSQNDLQYRLDMANRRIDDLAKELKMRDIELLKNLSEMNALRRQNDLDRRRADEMKNNLNAEITRLLRESTHAEQVFRENISLKSEIVVKEELLKKIMSTSTTSSLNDSRAGTSSNNSFSEGEVDEENAISRQQDACPKANDFTSLVTEMSNRIEKLEAENQELVERQTQSLTCGVCMDNRREVIFMPCLHFTCCKNCAEAMDHCSICRLRIMGKIEFFQ